MSALEILTGRVWREQAVIEPPMIIDRLLPAQALAFIGGEPGVGKSWLAWELALSVSSGAAFLGRYPVALGGGTLIVASEGSRRASLGRAAALARGKGLDPVAAIDAMHFLWRSPFRLVDAAHVRHVAEYVRCNNIRLVLIDTLHGSWGGRENDAESWSEVMRVGVRPLLAAGATVAVVHHTAKVSDSTGGRSAGQRLRGSSAMHGSRDCLLVLTRGGGKGNPHVRVTVELRDDAPVPPFAFRTPTSGQQIGLGDSFALEWQSLDATPTAPSDAALEQQVLDAVARANGTLSSNGVAKQLGGNRQRLYGVIKKLVESGVLTKGGSPDHALVLPAGKPVEQAENTCQNTLPGAQGVPGVPLVEGTEHAEHLPSRHHLVSSVRAAPTRRSAP